MKPRTARAGMMLFAAASILLAAAWAGSYWRRAYVDAAIAGRKGHIGVDRGAVFAGYAGCGYPRGLSWGVLKPGGGIDFLRSYGWYIAGFGYGNVLQAQGVASVRAASFPLPLPLVACLGGVWFFRRRAGQAQRPGFEPVMKAQDAS